MEKADSKDRLIISGDFNARVGANDSLWDGALGDHGVGKMNSNGLRLFFFLYEYQLTVIFTRFTSVTSIRTRGNTTAQATGICWIKY